MLLTRRSVLSELALVSGLAVAEPLQQAPHDELTTLDPDGTTQIKRSIPVPRNISPAAQKLLANGTAFAPDGWTKESAEIVKRMRDKYPVTVEESTTAGVKTKIVSPEHVGDGKEHRVLINFHGGGFTSDSGSLIETIPIASLTGTKVMAAEYRLAPQNPFPAAVDDAAAVYREVLKTHSPRSVAIYGTSAGAILTAQTAVRIRRLGLPMPAALGFFSGYADFARWGDSRAFYGVKGLIGFKPPDTKISGAYVGSHDPTDPELSPIYADLRGYPPTLCMTGTRDLILSGTIDFHRALLRADVDARLIVFDAMPHAHWYSFELPESQEALHAQAKFLDQHLS
jgi:epsilon-lactone hydrolase